MLINNILTKDDRGICHWQLCRLFYFLAHTNPECGDDSNEYESVYGTASCLWTCAWLYDYLDMIEKNVSDR